jgi:hypothetical protein
MTRKPQVPPPPPCGVCAKPTRVECSHIDCPNRRQLTACPPDDDLLDGDDGHYVVRPIFGDDQ